MMRALIAALALALASCGGTDTTDDGADDTAGDETTVEVVMERTREAPPESGTPRDIHFPPVATATTSSGLALNTVHFGQLPIVYLRLTIRSGSSTDPDDLPGVAHFVSQMLKEGTRRRTSAQIAEEIEFLGADLVVGDDEENLYVMVRALSEHLDEAMELLADVVRNPRFREGELRRLKARELDRLRLSARQPRYLARRTIYRELYGEHPYAVTDTNPDAVGRMRRSDLQSWHRANVVPSNSFLVAVGNVDPAAVQSAAEEHFRGWRNRAVAETTYADPPQRTSRSVIIVDRPSSEQSTIYVGNLALSRNSDDYVPLRVANQVLGGSAASRLFMDLREQRSLTYGAYSVVGERIQVAPFIAYARVRNEVTEAAVAGFMEHLDRIVAEEAPAEEIVNAQRYLSDSFPLQIETASRIAFMIEELRVYGLADDYWDGYRSAIRAVTPAQAHAAARAYIRPSQGLIVAVGRATEIVEPLRRYGPVRVIDTDGNEVSTFEQTSE